MVFLIFAINTFAAISPISNYLNFALRSGAPLDRLTARAHDGVKCLDPVDAVPKELRMMRLQFARTRRFGIRNFSNRTVAHRLSVFSKSQGRRAKHRHTLLFGQL